MRPKIQPHERRQRDVNNQKIIPQTQEQYTNKRVNVEEKTDFIWTNFQFVTPLIAKQASIRSWPNKNQIHLATKWKFQELTRMNDSKQS